MARMIERYEGSSPKTQQLVVGGRYSLGSVIGRGGSAVVYQAFQRRTGLFVAVKKFLATSVDESFLVSKKETNIVQEARRGMAREIELLSKLDHPNIVKYIEAFEENNTFYVVLEYMENGSLASVCRQFGNFPESVCAMYIRQVLCGLEYLHAQGVLHRDIKAANILTTKTGLAKLADFGLAARAASFSFNTNPDKERASIFSCTKEVDEDEHVMGSPYWMAPELIEMSAAPSAACDVWSLGITVVELTTGRPPHIELAPMAALFRIVQHQVPIPEGASEALRDFLLQCFHRESGLRVSAMQLLSHPWLERQQHGERINSPLSPSTQVQSENISQFPQEEAQREMITTDFNQKESHSTDLFKESHVKETPVTVSLKSLMLDYALEDEEDIDFLAATSTKSNDTDLGATSTGTKNEIQSTLVYDAPSFSSQQTNHTEKRESRETDEEEVHRLSEADLDAFLAGPESSSQDLGPHLADEERRLLARVERLVDSPGLHIGGNQFVDEELWGGFASPIHTQRSLTENHVDAPLYHEQDRQVPHQKPIGLAAYREDDDDGFYDDDFLEQDDTVASSGTKFLNGTNFQQSLHSFSDQDETSSDWSVDEAPADDPFATDFFDKETDFVHDHEREREAKRLEEIETLLERLPLALVKLEENHISEHQPTQIHKTETTCAALRRLLNGWPESSSLALSDGGIASLIEAMDLSRRIVSLQAQSAVIRVALSLGRLPRALDRLLALGMAPILARLAEDLEGSSGTSTVAASNILADVAALADMCCTRCSDEAVRIFVGGDGLRLLVRLLLPVSSDDSVDAKRWAAAKLAVDAIVAVLHRENQRRELQQGGKFIVSTGDPSIPSIRLTRNALCSALARLDAMPRLAAGLAAAVQLEDAARRGSHSTEAVSRRIAGAQALAERSASALAAFCQADPLVRERAAMPKTAKILLGVLSAAPKRVALMASQARNKRGFDEPMRREAEAHARLAVLLVKALKALTMASAKALDDLANAGAVEVVVKVLGAVQTGLFPNQKVATLRIASSDPITFLDDQRCGGNTKLLENGLQRSQSGGEHISTTRTHTSMSESNFDTVSVFKSLDTYKGVAISPGLKTAHNTSSAPDLTALFRPNISKLSQQNQRENTQWSNLFSEFPRRDELEDQLVPCLYYLCRIDRARLGRAAACGAARRLAECVARRRHLKQFALAVLCELCHAASTETVLVEGSSEPHTIASELWRAGGVNLFARLLVEAYWGVRALAALAAWLAKDTSRRVEAELATKPCAEQIVDLLRRASRSEFEHALTPLRDALERSPALALALLSVDSVTQNYKQYKGLIKQTPQGNDLSLQTNAQATRQMKPRAFAREIARRLRRHTSALVRKALLEILRAALKPSDQPQSILNEADDLTNTLNKLAQDTSQVLVCDLAASILSEFNDSTRAT
mmetsp:Transcript_15798/g.23769  ORF Transcript_15798/g.23769 Transcript_15798/m.23769 type:complete len:1427 (-) Transcript_15798:372-4652(-)